MVVQNAIPLNIQHINLNQQIEIAAVQAVEEAWWTWWSRSRGTWSLIRYSNSIRRLYNKLIIINSIT
jgi:hypothetical protein